MVKVLAGAGLLAALYCGEAYGHGGQYHPAENADFFDTTGQSFRSDLQSSGGGSGQVPPPAIPSGSSVDPGGLMNSFQAGNQTILSAPGKVRAGERVRNINDILPSARQRGAGASPAATQANAEAVRYRDDGPGTDGVTVDGVIRPGSVAAGRRYSPPRTSLPSSLRNR